MRYPNGPLDGISEYDVALKTLRMRRAASALEEVTGVRIARWLNVELPRVRNHRTDLLGQAEDGSPDPD
jgi:hypothetical protein